MDTVGVKRKSGSVVSGTAQESKQRATAFQRKKKPTTGKKKRKHKKTNN